MFKPQICLFIKFYILLLQLFQQHLSQYSYKRLPMHFQTTSIKFSSGLCKESIKCDFQIKLCDSVFNCRFLLLRVKVLLLIPVIFSTSL